MAILPPDPKYIFRGDKTSIHSLYFRLNSTEEHLYTGNSSGLIHVWDLKTNRERSSILTGEDPCLNIDSTNENNLLVQSKSGVLQIYRMNECQWALENSFDTNFPNYCRFQKRSENEIFVPLKNSNTGIFSLKTLKLEVHLDPSNLPSSSKLGEVMEIKPLKPGSELVLVGYEGGQLMLWDVRQLNIVSSLEIEPCPMALDFDYFLMKGIIGGPTNQLQVFNVSSNQALTDKTKITLKNPGTSVISIRSDSKILTVGGWDSRVRIWSWKNLQTLAVLDQHRDTVHDIAHSAEKIQSYDNKRLMATASKDGRVVMWDIYN